MRKSGEVCSAGKQGGSANASPRLRWSQAAARFDFAGAFASIADFLQSQGKQKYTLPIYRELVKGSE